MFKAPGSPKVELSFGPRNKRYIKGQQTDREQEETWRMGCMRTSQGWFYMSSRVEEMFNLVSGALSVVWSRVAFV